MEYNSAIDYNDTNEIDGTKFAWTNEMTSALIDEYTRLIDDFRNPYKRQNTVWMQVAQSLTKRGINVSYRNCDRKWRNLKNTYKRILFDNDRSEKSKCQWEFYKDLDFLFSSKSSDIKNKNIRKSRVLFVQPDDVENSSEYYEIKDESTVDESQAEDQDSVNISYVTDDDGEDDKNTVVEYLHDDEEWQNSDPNEAAQVQPNNEIHHTRSAVKRKGNWETKKSSPKRKLVKIKKESVSSQQSHQSSTIAEVYIADPEASEMELLDVDDSSPPIWFQNFMMRYECDTKLLQDKINKIYDRQTYSKAIIVNLSNRILKLENKINSLTE